MKPILKAPNAYSCLLFYLLWWEFGHRHDNYDAISRICTPSLFEPADSWISTSLFRTLLKKSFSIHKVFQAFHLFVWKLTQLVNSAFSTWACSKKSCKKNSKGVPSSNIRKFQDAKVTSVKGNKNYEAGITSCTK